MKIIMSLLKNGGAQKWKDSIRWRMNDYAKDVTHLAISNMATVYSEKMMSCKI